MSIGLMTECNEITIEKNEIGYSQTGTAKADVEVNSVSHVIEGEQEGKLKGGKAI